MQHLSKAVKGLAARFIIFKCIRSICAKGVKAIIHISEAGSQLVVEELV
jgi:hypothetical protein